MASASTCGTSASAPLEIAGNVSMSSAAPSSDSFPESVPVVSSSAIGNRRIAATGPVSSPASIRMIDTPVSASPRMIDHWIGAAPRSLGRREAWTLNGPRRGRSSSACGKDAAVGHHHEDVGGEPGQGVAELGGAHLLGL